MDEYVEGLMNVIEKFRKSKAATAPVITTPCTYMVANNPNRSKAASVPGINKVKAIHDFLKSDGRI